MTLGAINDGSGGESIVHITAIRLRVTGSGNLRARFISLDEIETQTLIPLVMTASSNVQPTRLANFQQQRAQLELKTTAINETFIINRIIIFAKPVFSEVPG